MTKRMGLIGKLFWGTAGSTATTELTIARDVNYNIEPQDDEVNDRSTKINLYDSVGVEFGLDFEINNKSTDTFVAAVRAAAFSGEAMAFRTRDHASGFGVDGDFIVKISETQPIRGAQRIKITAKASDQAGRIPTWV